MSGVGLAAHPFPLPLPVGMGGTGNLEGVNALFVGKHGKTLAQGATGKSWYTAFSTFAEALAAAAALTPAVDNRVAIICQDHGTYESAALAIPQYVSLIAPSARIKAKITLADDAVLVAHTIADGSGLGIEKTAGAGRAFAEVQEIIAAAGGSPSVGLFLTSGELIARVGVIRETAAAVGIVVNGGILVASIGTIITTTNWNVGVGATLDAFIGRAAGAAGVIAGTANVTVAGSYQPLNARLSDIANATWNTVGQVPRWNGANLAPAVIAVPITAEDATIGTGGDYAPTDVGLAAAIAAGRRSLLLLENVTLGADVNLPNAPMRWKGRLPGITIAAGAFQFITGGASSSLVSDGISFTYAYSSSKELFSGTFGIGGIDLRYGASTNTSSSGSTHIIAAANTQKFKQWTINAANVSSGGVRFAGGRLEAEDLHLVGGGSSCLEGVYNNSGSGYWFGGTVSGTFGTSGAAVLVTTIEVYGLELSATSSGTIKYQINKGTWRGGRNSVSAAQITVQSSGSPSDGQGIFRDVSIWGGAAILFDTNGVAENIGNAGQVNFQGFGDCRVQNVDCTSIASLTGDRNLLRDVRCTTGYTVGATADDTEILGGRVGATGGGGADTITVTAGSNRTRIVGVATDAAISDAGTGTVAVGNTEY